jgi:hypothetical protein
VSLGEEIFGSLRTVRHVPMRGLGAGLLRRFNSATITGTTLTFLERA